MVHGCSQQLAQDTFISSEFYPQALLYLLYPVEAVGLGESGPDE